MAESRQCDPLTVTDVEKWIAQGVLSDKIEIPPQRIAIGRLLPFLGTYIEIKPGSIRDPVKRKSAVFLFDWSEPQKFELLFRRVSESRQIPSSRSAAFKMQGHRHWIHHERADSLLPAYGIEWVLATGDDEEIRLRTTGGSSEP